MPVSFGTVESSDFTERLLEGDSLSIAYHCRAGQSHAHRAAAKPHLLKREGKGTANMWDPFKK